MGLQRFQAVHLRIIGYVAMYFYKLWEGSEDPRYNCGPIDLHSSLTNSSAPVIHRTSPRLQWREDNFMVHKWQQRPIERHLFFLDSSAQQKCILNNLCLCRGCKVQPFMGNSLLVWILYCKKRSLSRYFVTTEPSHFITEHFTNVSKDTLVTKSTMILSTTTTQYLFWGIMSRHQFNSRNKW